MKKVILKSLEMNNFKGEKHRKTDFHVQETTIKGPNASGKSRHFDAFTWLLFGKDAQDRTDYEIKTRLANGEELHKVDCYVEGVINVDGEDIVLKRCLVEKWKKPHGQQEQVFDGNKTECYWNNAPVSVSEYAKRVQDILDTNVFKMITNPTFFPAMKWQLQREQLFMLAGTITDAEIAQGNHDYELLLDRIPNKSVDDFKRERSATKKRLKQELDEVQPRIEQTQKMCPESEDFDAVREAINAKDSEIAIVDASIASVVEANKAKYDAQQSIQSNINDLKRRQQDIVFLAKGKESERVFQANNARSEIENTIQVKTTQMKGIEYLLKKAQDSCKEEDLNILRICERIKERKEEQDKLREKWHEINAREYQGETTCPNCHQQLPDDMIQQARDLFVKNKQKQLEDITAQGKRWGDEIADFEAQAKECEAKKKKYEHEITQRTTDIYPLDKDIHELKQRLADMPVEKAQDIKGEDIEEWRVLQSEIDKLSENIEHSATIDTSSSELQAKKRALMNERDNLNTRLFNEKVIEKCNREIAQLEARAKELAQQIADIEHDEYILQSFTRAKIDECEKRVNTLFKFVQFRLYDYTQDGNAVEVCVPMINGVPYGSANTASRLNAGLDIINTLSRFYGICAPIFLDNRESTLYIVETQSQIVNLVTTNDKELNVRFGRA